MKIGFIGLGHMGRGIAHNILKAGHDLTVWNRSPAAAQEFGKLGAHVAKSIEDTLQGDAVFSMLPTDGAIREQGLDGTLLAKAAKGLIHVNMATISIAFAKDLATSHDQHGLAYISAPVFGRPDAAERGELVVVRGGNPDAIAKLQSVFAAIGKRQVDAGEEAWKANLFKMSGNMMIASALETMGEVCALLRKGGVDHAQFIDTMANTLFASPVYQGYGRMIVAEAFSPAGFTMKLGQKDVNLVREAGKDLEVPVPLADFVSARFQKGIDTGLGEKEWAATAALAAQEAGL
jgi:3-hydroxyisobutyrate dehydrogenase-like beta-hydroxyacid dehydrogenase